MTTCSSCTWLTFPVTELVAYGRTTEEIARHINADAIVFQDLDDLNAACTEASEGKSEVKDYEVGVFSGNYVTDVPEGYFEHLSNLRGNKDKGMFGASDSPVDVSAGPQMTPGQTSNGNGALASPEYSEDVK